MILLNKHLHRNIRLNSQNQTKLHSRYSLVMLLMSCLLLVACNPGDLGRAVTGWTPIAFDTETSMLFSVDQDGYVKALKDNGYDGLSASWKYPPNKEDRLIGSFHPPVIHGESIFLTGANGHTYSINKSNGSLQDGGWRAPETLGVELPRLYSGIAIDEINNVGFVPDETGTLQGYKLETGKPLDWNFTAEAGIWGTPVIDENRIISLGSPRHDDYFNSKLKNQKKNKITILLAPNPIGDISGLSSTDLKLRVNNVILKIFSTVKQLDNFEIIVKLHSSQLKHNKEIHSFIKNYDSTIPIYLSKSVIDTINDVDLVITVSPETYGTSTMILESMILGKPTINIVFNQKPFEFEHVKSKSVFIISDYDELEKELKKILLNQNIQNKLLENAHKFVNTFVVLKSTSSKSALEHLRTY